MKLDPTKLIHEKCRRDLHFMCKYESPHWQWDKPHHDLLFKELEEQPPGTILVIELPIRHGKSELCTVRNAAHRVLNPRTHVLMVGNKQDLAESFSRSTKTVLKNLKVEFGDVDGYGEWQLANGSSYYAVGVGGAVEGRGFNYIIIDDPIRTREDAESELIRNKVWQWFTETVWGRREPGCKVVIIMSRWHEDDIVGRLKEGAFYPDLVKVVTLKALAEEDDILGRDIDCPLWPERYSFNDLDQERLNNPRNFYSRFQNTPISSTGSVFSGLDKMLTRPLAHVDLLWRCAIAFDPASSDGTKNDFTAMCRIWKPDNGPYYIELKRVRLTTHMRNEWIKSQVRNNKHDMVFIPEDPGSSGVDNAKTMVAMLAPYVVKTGKNTGSKVARAEGIAAQIEAGNVILVTNEFSTPFINECKVFPNGKNDDMVDALSYAFNFINSHRFRRARTKPSQTVTGVLR